MGGVDNRDSILTRTLSGGMLYAPPPAWCPSLSVVAIERQASGLRRDPPGRAGSQRGEYEEATGMTERMGLERRAPHHKEEVALIELPLTRANRISLARAFRDVRRVDLSVECAIEGQMGKAYVDDAEHPAAFAIEQSGFFCYLAGDPHAKGGGELVKTLSSPKLLMPSAPGWIELAREVHGDKLKKLTRYSFSSHRLSLEHLEGLLARSRFKDSLRRIDPTMARHPGGLVDISAFDSAEDFAERGIGYCLLDGDTMTGAAYSSLVCSQGIEISLYVLPDYRMRGVGTALAASLLRWCLEHHMDPHWDAANPESCGLAGKLGYVPDGTYEAHFLIS
jgi:GNAT superfamily N-acetyltransferase